MKMNNRNSKNSKKMMNSNHSTDHNNIMDQNMDFIEIDDMNIKARLNHSLDLSGITVSEDLIRRTLIKIKESPKMLDDESQQEELAMQKLIAKKEQNNQMTKEEMPSYSRSFREKIIPFSRYVRSLAGIAAAVTIFIVGINAVQNLGSKSSTETTSTGVDNSTVMTTEMQRSTNETATEEAAKTEESNSYDVAATDGNTADAVDSALIEDSKSLKFGSTEDTAADAEEDTEAAESTQAADLGTGSDGAEGEVTDAELPQMTTAFLPEMNNEALSFRDIFLPDPEQAVSLIITDETNAASVLLTEPAEILDFYTVMDSYQFTAATESASVTNYSIEIVTAAPDESDYLLIIGDKVTVRYVVGAITSEELYQTADLELLKQAVSEFYLKYKE